MNINKISIFLIILIIIVSCKNNENSQIRNIKKHKDSLHLIKDTIILGESAEGTDVKLFKVLQNNDSIIKVETFGEMGNSIYEFRFNKKILNIEHITNQYEEPISINSTPKIRDRKIELLNKSNKNELTNVFYQYKNLFKKEKFNKNEVLINSKWIGNYSFIINEDSDDWRVIYNIKLMIKSDSIIFHAEGYQIDQNYKLFANEDENKIHLSYEKSLDNFISEVLKKSNDFGVLTFDGTNYIWECSYIDLSFNDKKKQSYILKKNM